MGKVAFRRRGSGRQGDAWMCTVKYAGGWKHWTTEWVGVRKCRRKKRPSWTGEMERRWLGITYVGWMEAG